MEETFPITRPADSHLAFSPITQIDALPRNPLSLRSLLPLRFSLFSFHHFPFPTSTGPGEIPRKPRDSLFKCDLPLFLQAAKARIVARRERIMHQRSPRRKNGFPRQKHRPSALSALTAMKWGPRCRQEDRDSRVSREWIGIRTGKRITLTPIDGLPTGEQFARGEPGLRIKKGKIRQIRIRRPCCENLQERLIRNIRLDCSWRVMQTRISNLK